MAVAGLLLTNPNPLKPVIRDVELREIFLDRQHGSLQSKPAR
jgi:hypothetical protein